MLLLLRSYVSSNIHVMTQSFMPEYLGDGHMPVVVKPPTKSTHPPIRNMYPTFYQWISQIELTRERSITPGSPAPPEALRRCPRRYSVNALAARAPAAAARSNQPDSALRRVTTQHRVRKEDLGDVTGEV
ncbi:hypothetical protein DPEC_G00183950 [Dallia pectoralis]|uniref:Uncharacterized protein n=1 Tax=Dallia pectoralis TaxID=75939 RepID=A0ACC2GB27_DALPE|nr:hypothetical protein DPEC_G00183950 [Dallia pectoralis]